jgi:hypothetical protein
MSDRKIIFTAVGIVIILLLFYFTCFWGASVSTETADWGAFGNYAAICVSILSIAFIYVTYREQKNTNEIARTEQHVAIMVNTILSLSENKQTRLKSICTKICEHFKEPFPSISDYQYESIVKVCVYYYSTIAEEDIDNLKYLIQYTHLSIDFIIHDKSLSNESKHLRLTELTCIIPESVRIILFFWLTQNSRTDLKEFYPYGIFSLNDNNYSFLEDIITYVCTTKCPPDRPVQEINVEDIILEDYQYELFSETYLRLNRKENKE